MDHNRANAQEVRPVEAKAKNMISHAVNTTRTFSLLVLLLLLSKKESISRATPLRADEILIEVDPSRYQRDGV